MKSRKSTVIDTGPTAELSAGPAVFQLWVDGKAVTRLAVPPGLATLRAAAGEVVSVELLSPGGTQTERVVKDTAAYLTKFLAGVDPGARPALDLEGLTPFTRAVLLAACDIPWGQVDSYGWVAERAGVPGAARAAGGALGRNPLPLLVPCHRVVRADGATGGFGLGTPYKRWLLALESGRPGAAGERGA